MFISVFLGVVSDVNFVNILLRAFIFGALFFGLGFGLRFAVNSFFPELLYNEDEVIPPEMEAGSRVDITLDSSGEYAVPELYKNPGDSSEMGNIEDLISGIFRSRREPREQVERKTSENDDFIPLMSDESLDGLEDAGYNDVQAEKPLAVKPQEEKPLFTPSFGDDSGLGGLPDLDMMARAFSSAYSSSPVLGPSAPVAEASTVTELPSVPSVQSTPSSFSVSASDDIESTSSYYKGNKPHALEGDFDAKSLAEGIRTVLSKDN